MKSSEPRKFIQLLPHPVLTMVLWIIWLLLNNTLAPGHIVLGFILAVIIPLLTTSFWPEKIILSNPWVIFKFFWVVIWDILIANMVVAKLILGPSRRLKPGFVLIDLEIQHPLGISILANTISLTPGTVSCDVSPDRKQLKVHALHLENEMDTIHEIKQRYETPLIKVFQSC
ncbi:Na+/H+ antiporter subunit E [Hydrogenovibrio sp. SC-1]|uniref:Na+/H+ antiporter subunit E n=1 Tax=Hydrogenovibrio sp. SC-1 TaxID=2065820 RepID=UPI000C7D5514|nr:Na+/H+ antiporter subunit E [Hydrogenovibrio sp. SC-1]PLA75329.1 Na+/H+ antiporter subunit E [Hydrogenovibrio sp. SC-1]